MPLSPLAPGEIGAIVTSLEMTSRPVLGIPPVSSLRLDAWDVPNIDAYRALYRRIGEPWLWVSRLALGDAALSSIIHDPKVRIWAVCDEAGLEVGILELDFREAGQCEIGFFGLLSERTGKGHGKWLMAMALKEGWSEPGVKRMWVHTCTLDSPGALHFYIRSGFTPYERLVESFSDPRLTGLYPRDAAPQIPLIE